MSVTHITSDDQFHSIVRGAPGLVVADFFATWCGPCQRIAPRFEQLAATNPNVAFLKIDVDQCGDLAQSVQVRMMPTFKFYVGGVCVDTVTGADPAVLEQKIQHWGATGRPAAGWGDEGSTKGVAGYLDLTTFIAKKDCECLNESDDHNLAALFSGQRLESDCDEQLLMNIHFNQPVKVHSILVKSTGDDGPKLVRLFINQPKTLDFDTAARMEATQELLLTEDAVSNGDAVNLRFVKFQNVQCIQVFVKDNFSGNDVTRIDELRFFGTPLEKTKMDDFKRVAGKKGEAH